MAKLKIIVHPLFFVFGIYFALTGKVFSFILTVLSALVHEFGHFIASERCGYKLDKIVLMPYGAVISGNDSPFKYADEIYVSLAGPIINYLIVIIFTALWWFFPETYAFTDYVVLVNLSLATINLLPCYPLDGGRVLLATLCLYFSRKISLLICKIIGLIFSLCLLGLFIYSCFNGVNISLLFFSLFILFGVFTKPNTSSYIRIFSQFSLSQYKKGVEVKKVAILQSAKLKTLCKVVGSKPCEIDLINYKGVVIRRLNPIEAQKLLSLGNLYETIEKNVKSIK